MKKQKLTLDQPVVYQIKVPGHVGENWKDWFGEMVIEISSDDTGLPLTTLTGSLDQAALLGLLRRLNTFGLPLISVHCLEIS